MLEGNIRQYIKVGVPQFKKLFWHGREMSYKARRLGCKSLESLRVFNFVVATPDVRAVRVSHPYPYFCEVTIPYLVRAINIFACGSASVGCFSVVGNDGFQEVKLVWVVSKYFCIAQIELLASKLLGKLFCLVYDVGKRSLELGLCCNRTEAIIIALHDCILTVWHTYEVELKLTNE